ncbi:MAG: hypothetical protein KatS3mg059_1480 [Thermomicrobiales bacterium]|nr:MAG: hypothetical protein KatS3mg059_1480 [Thermomicrobiales bacterium]
MRDAARIEQRAAGRWKRYSWLTGQRCHQCQSCHRGMGKLSDVRTLNQRCAVIEGDPFLGLPSTRRRTVQRRMRVRHVRARCIKVLYAVEDFTMHWHDLRAPVLIRGPRRGRREVQGVRPRCLGTRGRNGEHPGNYRRNDKAARQVCAS